MGNRTWKSEEGGQLEGEIYFFSSFDETIVPISLNLVAGLVSFSSSLSEKHNNRNVRVFFGCFDCFWVYPRMSKIRVSSGPIDRTALVERIGDP